MSLEERRQAIEGQMEEETTTREIKSTYPSSLVLHGNLALDSFPLQPQIRQQRLVLQRLFPRKIL